jgi:hypothetical protein
MPAGWIWSGVGDAVRPAIFSNFVAFQSVDEFMAWAPMAPVLLRRFILSDFVGAFLRL